MGDGAGFWSNEYGWTKRSFATRFTSKEIATFEEPRSSRDDTVILQEDDRLDFYVVTLADEEGGTEGAYHFKCWAECESHASEQASNAYPQATIISVEAVA